MGACSFQNERQRVTKQAVRLDRSVEVVVGECQAFWAFQELEKAESGVQRH